ncbi:2-C-methyl-D-erythritol 4-phosphate cytidylyltransferase [Pedobacter hiemivivus]|uniref:2-C-methyl-D-erythritol 4-phosphate cytidylyltransferase n=1 Tax=Pedobacter hiemivivus TaxID=2530454 RepID=A0A4R0MNT4_9SPHI|nr:2-C-methyl-D-erythritol 4-phosphate cytidylyltransferase [Pedobacter hiemivivus]TCC88445.1 2-C-methyl-D-erythritol 4-phosphate cytidylyltransferase [Pedobacter hiemivivus]TKC58443.1 2-C-methyl-D-erythritol 4-phosphate cytidylyltransferase [Pedobacter hiemivivus]
MKYYAIIVAGGSGNRMQSAVPKQFLLLDKQPVLMHTITAFHSCALNPHILLVLNIDQHKYWEELCLKYNFTIPHQVVNGGAQRYHSVKNGLKAIKGKGIVAVHDAVRPLISVQLITKSYQVTEETGNCIIGITPTDSVRRVLENGKSEALSRDELVLIQTPQTFEIDLLRKAYQAPFRNEFTDDASVAEYAGFKINLIAGERENIKITHPEDLEIASILKRMIKRTP